MWQGMKWITEADTYISGEDDGDAYKFPDLICTLPCCLVDVLPYAVNLVKLYADVDPRSIRNRSVMQSWHEDSIADV